MEVKQTSRVKELRRRMSPPEVRLWAELRKRPHGLKFRRQHPAGMFILDFFCARAGLAIEVDGQVHDMGFNPDRDFARDLALSERGIRTLRFQTSEIMNNIEGVLRIILDEALARAPSTASRSPSPGKPGEED